MRNDLGRGRSRAGLGRPRVWAAVTALSLTMMGLVVPASASSHLTGALSRKGSTPIAQGRYLKFDSQITNIGASSETVEVVLLLMAPGGASTPFLRYAANLDPNESLEVSRWVSSAKFFAELGDFTIQMTAGGVVLDELVYEVIGADVQIPTFEDVTALAGVGAGEGPGGKVCQISEGAAWADVDLDDDLDLFSPSVEPATVPHHLWINDGSGHFTDESLSRGITDLVPGMGAVFADFDNDGDADLYRANDGPNQLYQNDGTGMFTDVAVALGVADPAMTQSAAWADYDRDGRLDLYSVNYGDCTSPGDGFPGNYQADRLYHQLPDGTFEDVSDELPAASVPGAGFQASFLDYDDDGDVDIYVANDYLKLQTVVPDHNRLFRNDGPGLAGWTWTDDTVAASADYKMNSMGIAVGDPDGDLDLDMVISNIGDEKYARNNGDGTFTSMEKKSKLAEAKGSLPSGDPAARQLWTWGEVFADFNNDRSEDLYAAASHMMGFMIGDDRPNRVLTNGRDGTFLDVSAASGANDRGYTRGVAVADYDRDGRLDVFSVNKAVPSVLYRNTTPGSSHWLEIDTVGTISNKDGCGAKVILTTAGGAQRRDVFCGSTSLGSGVDSTLHFGLRGDTSILSLVVTWPSGIVQNVPVPAVDQLIEVVEPTS